MERTVVKFAGQKKFIAYNRRHAITVDVPKEFGGADEGPTPPELFIDALASCIGIYVLGFCKTAGLNAEGLTISADWEKEITEKPYYIKNIDVKISLPNADAGKRRGALLKAAHSCLVHATIHKQPAIKIELA